MLRETARCEPVRRRLWLALLLAAVLIGGTVVRADKLPLAAPADVGMDSRVLDMIDRVAMESVRRERMPGAVVAVGRRGQIVFLRAYGNRSVQPIERPMTTDTVFDLASLTKPIATATSVMQLIERGDLDLTAPVSRYLPEFAANGKQDVTLYQLLTHTGGLIPDNALKDYLDGPEQAWQRIFDLKLTAEPGSKFQYTDVGFLVLGRVVERVSGQKLDDYARQHIFEPLKMTETGFNPPEVLRLRAAPTEQRDGGWIQGQVHDPRSWALQGVAGHAGLFSTAADLARYAQALLHGGRLEDARILRDETVALMGRGSHVPGGLRGLGWDVRTGYSSNRGDLLSDDAFGHGGFTGTAMWIDPKLELFVIFLSNRVHPDGRGLVNPTAGRIATLAAASALSATPREVIRPIALPAVKEVLTGVDVLQRDGFPGLQGKRVGLITNHTGRTRDGTSTIAVFHRKPQVTLVRIFSPEHGIAGRLDVARIDDSTEGDTGIPIVSLYGKTRRPQPEHLRDLDVLVFDIQDIGTRFYTYISTMGEAMRAAAEAQIEFVVLDRPNPINGVDVAGPVLDAGQESFVGYHPIAVQHGMTTGELAGIFRDELKLELKLRVVRVEGWQRADLFDRTGLTWTNPSPNMRNLTQALLYPGIGLLETTNISVGRGTDTPFEILGAPWIDGRRLSAALNQAALPGLRAVPVEFTPESSKHANQLCQGIRLIVTDRNRLQSVRTGLMIAWLLRAQYPEDWNTTSLNRLLADERVFQGILAGKHPDELELRYRDELSKFVGRRQTYLLYD